jgi:hypothetical protein
MVVVLFAVSAGAQTARPATRPFIPAKDTTVVTGPLRPDGTIDYVAALNAICAKGVTRENNAAVPLLEVFETDNEKSASALARERVILGIKPAATPLTPLRRFAERNWKEGDDLDWHDAEDKLDELTKSVWKAGQLPVAAKWLEAVRQPLDRVAEASKRDRFDIPYVCDVEPPTMLHVQYGYLSPMRGAVSALRARALLRLGAGDFEGFRSDTLAILRIGRLASHTPTLVEKLVAIGCERLGLETLRAAIFSADLSAEQCDRLAADLRALLPAAPLGDCFATGERFMLLDYLVTSAVYGPAQAGRMMSGKSDNLRPIDTSAKDWNAALRNVNGWYDRMVEAGRKPTPEERMAAGGAVGWELERLANKWSGLVGAFAPIEERMLTIMAPSMSRTFQAEIRGEVDEDLTLLTLALQAFKTREGHYPQKLDELTPRYFKTVPTDRFSQQPLIYRLEDGGFVLYSVGFNGRDDHGDDDGKFQGKSDDIAVRSARAR